MIHDPEVLFGAFMAALVILNAVLHWLLVRRRIARLTTDIEEIRKKIDPDEEDSHTWLCDCGHFEESQFDCGRCGREPPWGCLDDGCSRHHDPDPDDWEGDYDDIDEESFVMAADRKCRLCGCTDADCSGCVEKTGQRCSWVALDLCSACAAAAQVEAQEERRPAP